MVSSGTNARLYVPHASPMTLPTVNVRSSGGGVQAPHRGAATGGAG